MKKYLAASIVIIIFTTLLTSCSDGTNKKEEVSSGERSIEAKSGKKNNESSDIFENPRELTLALSNNGIGELKEWSNPMEMGWGSLSDYYQFGPKKNGVGMQNNIAYYIEGTKDKATKMYINLNINNPADKKNALKFLNEISEKTFRSLNMAMPKELSDAILNSKQIKTEVAAYTVSTELSKSKIETWKINIEKK